MASDNEILQAVREAFAGCPRSEHFTNYKHCVECAEHDELLRARDIDTLRIEDVGNVCSDPICFITVEGFLYYLPALARLALDQPVDDNDWYASSLLFHLCGDGPNNRKVQACTPEQRRVIWDFLNHLVETRSALADHSYSADHLLEALEIWSPAPAP